MWKVLLLSCVAVAAADVRRPPKITTSPKALLVYEQNSKDLLMDCAADGEPAVTYSWEKNGQEFSMNRETVTPSKVNGSFVFSVVNTADAGYYQCFAKNLYGKAMSQISSLQRAVLAAFPTRTEPFKYEVNQGDKLMVHCNSPKSYPEPTHSWAIADNMEDKNPDEITQSKRIMIDLNGDLHFANVEPNDYQGGRIYMCRAYNPNLRTLKAGSESQIIVNTGSPSSSRPMLEFQPSQSEVVLAGRTMTFQCIFSGFPTPNVKFSRVGGAMPYERYKSLKHGTIMQITNVTEADEGQYKCTGSNSDTNGENSFEFNVDVEVIPIFEATENQPHNVNKTEGESVEILCNPKAEPEASIQWFSNGEPIDSNSPGPRMSITGNNRKLTIIDLCKTCNNGKTDLQVIQCNASNEHGYAFAEGYINVLEKTKMTVKPKDVSMVTWEEDVIFECEAESDDSTPVQYTWLFNDFQVDTNNEAYEIVDGHNLKVDAVLLANQDKKKAEGKYTCKVTNGESQESADAYLTIPNDPAPIVVESGTNWVLIIVIIVVVILLLLLLLLICCLCMQRSKGDEYPVDEKEKKAGLDPERELKDDAFQNYQRPEAQPFKGSRASLTSTIQLNNSDDDESLTMYGEPDTSKFNEDGSFLGEYTEKRKPRGGDSIV